MNELTVNENKGQLARAEIDMQITTAKAYPRNLKTFLDAAIEMATYDEETAESCVYSLPRGGKAIKGPSIRLAEIALSAWGNSYVGGRIIENKDGYITAEGHVWDLERNVRVQKQVRRKITNNTMDTQENAAISIALRNAILGVIPGPLIKHIYNAAVSNVVGDKSKVASKVKVAFEKFQKKGIESKVILDYFAKKNISEINEDDYLELVGIANAIHDGRSTMSNAFKRQTFSNTSADALTERLADEPLSQEDKEFYGED